MILQIWLWDNVRDIWDSALQSRFYLWKCVSTPCKTGKAKTVENMGLTGLEPVTLRLSSACSNQLSYRPGKLRGQFIVRSEIRNAISENWTQGDYAPASASDNVPCLLDVASTASRLCRQGDSNL